MTDAHRSFERACSKAFGFLCHRFAFAEPEFEQIGREAYVRFHKGALTVSIAWEPGAPPLVELFLPAHNSGEPQVPWAARDGVPYARRIPPLRAPAAFNQSIGARRRRHAWSEPDESLFERYLAEIGRELVLVESDFLNADA